MPAIDAADTYDGSDVGWDFLDVPPGATITLLFAGTTLPSTSLIVKYTDDEGVDQALENGTITALPTSLTIGPISLPLKIVATGGSPNLNVTHGGTTRGTV